MAMLGLFIGIDRYSDSRVRDLAAARRDATALWALFQDTLPAMVTKLLADAEGTVDAVRRALDESLGAAGEDDTVIVSFSCHGSHQHQIALHDTDLDRLADTTIPMAELASRFKQTKAKAVLCVLDCCFSGGAPAKVLEDSPISRDLQSPLDAFAGAGRILLAASGVNEPALESSLIRHGLLTKAVMDALEGSGPSVSLTTAADQILASVRAEAAKMNCVQTPVFLGHIEGGLTLPSLRRGKRYFEAFPEMKGVRVGGDLSELTQFGLPNSVIEAWTEQFGGAGLNELQLAAVNDQRILDGESLLVVAPTSSGKTFVGEMAAARAVLRQEKAVFLFPYKALVNEKFDGFSRIYGDKLGMRVIRCTGDHQDHTNAFCKGKYDIAVLTYETFLGLVIANGGVVNLLGLVVIDEAQFITDPKRGIVVELIFTYLIAARNRGIKPQLVALSAVIGNVNSFDEWLGIPKLIHTKRPVPLVEGVLDRSGQFQFLDSTGKQGSSQLLPYGAVQQRGKSESAQDVIVPLVRKLLQDNPNEQVIIFRNQKGSAQGCAKYLSNDLGLPEATEALTALPHNDPSTSSTALRECLSGGTAFHTTDLSREEREVVERSYRKHGSAIRALAATTTVAAGINTPASTVILAEQEFVGEDGRPFTIAEYKNMAGRAGRLGFKEQGKSIILADNPHERFSLFNRYVLGKPGEMRSSFAEGDIETWVLRLLAQVKRVARVEVPALLANTYGGYLSIKANPKWQSNIELVIARLLGEMITLGLLEEEAGILQLSLLGRACGQSSLSFRSAMRLVALLQNWTGPLEAETLMVLIQGLKESDEIYTPVMKKGHKENRWPMEVVRKFGQSVAQILQRFVADEWTFVARCKKAMILDAYINGTSMEAIEINGTANPFQGKIGAGNVRQFADATRFHLASAAKIVSLLLLENSPSGEHIDQLLKQLEIGIPTGALGLMQLPISLTRGEYLALYNAGVLSKEDVWALKPETLSLLVGKRRGEELTEARA